MNVLVVGCYFLRFHSYFKETMCSVTNSFNLISVLLIAFCEGYSEDGIRTAFGTKSCIQSSLSTFHTHSFGVKDSRSSLIANITALGQIENTDKSILSKLNELVQFNELEYNFKLEKEEGPSHDKVFTVSLIMGKETFVGEGKSLKKAKQNVAAIALANTEYDKPPEKEPSEYVEALTPTVMLNNLGAKLGLGINYFLVDKEKQQILNSNLVVSEKPKKSYVQKLNDSIYSNKNLRMKKDIDHTKGPFNVKVQVGDHEFFGYAHSIKVARHQAASNALDFLIKNKENLNLDCLKEGSEEQCKKAKQNLKSPISIVYEAGQMRKLDVEFEIIKESGPAHKKTFVTECKLGHLKTTGEGRSKKESKKAAAENMLEKMSELEPISQEMQVKSMLKDKKKKKKKKKMLKNKLDEISVSVGNAIDSVVGFGKDILTDNKADGDTDEKSSDGPKSKKGFKSKHLKQSYQDQILELSNSLNFQISYVDFEEGSKHFSLLSLHINPEYLCFGEASSERDARNRAADKGLDLLNKMGIFDHLSDQKTAPLERDTKEAIRQVLQHDIFKDEKDEL